MPATRPSGARGWVLPTLMVAMVTLPLAEIWLIIQAGQVVGAWPTVLWLIGGAMLGAWLFRREGSKAWSALLGALTRGSMPTGELADAALVLTGGILLMLPGFFTDVVGLFCLLPLTRPLGRSLLAAVAARAAAKRGIDITLLRPHRDPGGVVIQGEVVQDESTPQDQNEVFRGEIET